LTTDVAYEAAPPAEACAAPRARAPRAALTVPDAVALIIGVVIGAGVLLAGIPVLLVCRARTSCPVVPEETP